MRIVCGSRPIAAGGPSGDATYPPPAAPAPCRQRHRDQHHLAPVIALGGPCLHHLGGEERQRTALWPRELEARDQGAVPLPPCRCADEDDQAADHAPRLVESLGVG